MSLATRMAEAQLALMLLTRLPAGRIAGEAPPLGNAAWAFPLVGALIGALSGAIFWLSSLFGLPPLASALLAISASALLTGGLHEDGLADMADGFGGGRDPAKKLEIMRDSRLGSYGALALVLVIGLTASGISAAGGLAIFVAIGAMSRTAMLLPLMLLPPARADGLGAAAATPINKAFWVALAGTVILAIPAQAGWPAVFALGATVAVMLLARRQIGGQTGDILGATQKLAECAAWLTASALCCSA